MDNYIEYIVPGGVILHHSEFLVLTHLCMARSFLRTYSISNMMLLDYIVASTCFLWWYVWNVVMSWPIQKCCWEWWGLWGVLNCKVAKLETAMYCRLHCLASSCQFTFLSIIWQFCDVALFYPVCICYSCCGVPERG
jgi:hypothetical protein